MSNATKTLSALFVIILAITGIYKLTNNTNASKDLRNPLVKFDASKLNRISIKSDKVGDVLLQKKSGTWMVKEGSDGKTYKADPQLVKRAIKEINGIMPTAVVTRDKSNFRRYQVDTTGTKLSLSSGNKVLAKVYLGRVQYSGPESVVTYIRPAGQNNVYSVNGFLGRTFNKKLNNWRNKQIWKIHESHIKQLDMIYPADSSFSMVKVDKVKWMYGRDTLKTYAVNNILDQLMTLNATNFVNNLNPGNFGKPLYEIKIHMDNDVVKDIKFKPDPKDSLSYMATASNYPYVFTENKAIFNEDVFRSKKDLIKKIKHPKTAHSKVLKKKKHT